MSHQGGLVEFGVLGPVEVRAGGQLLDAGHARRRAVLAVLLLDLGRVVPLEALIDRVWGQEPPASVLNTLYGYIARLRSVIARAPDPRVTLSRRPGGYLLQAEAGQLDFCRFRWLAAEASTGPDDKRSAGLLRQALGLWRGPALVGVRSPWLNAMRDTLEADRLAALADLTDIRLRQGEHGALAAELTRQAAARPGDERLIAQFMLALYRSGRQADALRIFEQTRRHLASEVGADPGSALRTLHQQILRADPALAAVAGVSVRQGPVPRQLPPGVPAFTGRAAELADLDGLLTATGAEGTTPAAIAAVTGTAGAGKTALAVGWARRSAHRFRDGQLYADLRGFGPADAPAATAETIAGFLTALGIPAERAPAGQDQQVALYRSLLADKQMLIVLDNARNEQQVRPLLPVSPRSLVLVTSRIQLAGLVATDGARLVTLDLLPHGEAVQMLTARLGRQATAEPAAIGEIADLCARLPIALAVAAARAAARPRLPLQALAAEIRDTASPLDALDSGDPEVSVRTTFSWSYQQLSTGAARMFRLLGLHAIPDITPRAAASLAGVDESVGRRMLSELGRAQLLAEHIPGRYTCHDLLRAYAADEVRAQDSHADRTAAIRRLLDHYLYTAVHGAFLLHSAHEPVELAAPAPGVSPEPLVDARQALAWFKAEQHVLVAAVTLALQAGFDVHAREIRRAMTPFLAETVRILASADALLADEAAWDRSPTRTGEPVNGRYTLYSALATACREITDGSFHLHPALQAVHAAIEDPVPARPWEHRLADFNAVASFEDVKAVLAAAIAANVA
jgi:DNA-binding SARP family transcriptional activator